MSFKKIEELLNPISSRIGYLLYIVVLFAISGYIVRVLSFREGYSQAIIDSSYKDKRSLNIIHSNSKYDCGGYEKKYVRDLDKQPNDLISIFLNKESFELAYRCTTLLKPTR